MHKFHLGNELAVLFSQNGWKEYLGRSAGTTSINELLLKSKIFPRGTYEGHSSQTETSHERFTFTETVKHSTVMKLFI